jgi:hypothetical protein
MKYHLLIQAASGPLPCGPREAEHPPEIGSRITETVEGRQLRLEVVGHQHLPIVPGGTFAHAEVWVVCRQLANG